MGDFHLYLDDRLQDILAFKMNNNYVKHYPYFETIDFRPVLHIDYKTHEFLSDEKLNQISSGKHSYPLSVQRAVDAWLFNSPFYCHSKYLEFRESDANLALDWYKSATSPRAKKQELALVYREDGKRLDDLFNILFGEVFIEKIKMSSWEIDIPIRHFQREFRELEYDNELHSFFLDFENAHDFIKNLKGEYLCNSNDFFEDISASATGRSNIWIQGDAVKLNGIIRREGVKDLFSARTFVTAKIDSDKFESTLSMFYPDFKEIELSIPADLLVFADDESTLVYDENNSLLEISAKPSAELEHFIHDLLTKIL